MHKMGDTNNFIETQEDFVADDLQKLLRRVNTCEKRYKEILETSSHGIQVIDIYGKITYINSVQGRFLGYTLAESEGRDIWELLAYDTDREELTGYLTELAQKGYSSHPWIGKYVTKENKIRKLQMIWSCMRDEHGNIIGFVSFTTL